MTEMSNNFKTIEGYCPEKLKNILWNISKRLIRKFSSVCHKFLVKCIRRTCY